MSSLPQARALYEFGPFRLDPAENRLWRDGVPVALTPKAFETLLALVSRAGRLVDKAELLREVWPDTVVEESSLSQHVYLVRKALGEERGESCSIETVPKRGYRFVAPVRVLAPVDNVESAENAPSSLPLAAERPAALGPPPARGRFVFARAPRLARQAASAAVALAALVALTAVLRRPETAPVTADAPPRSVARTASARAVAAARGQDALGLGVAAGGPTRVPRGPEAFDAYVRGLYFWNQRTAEGVKNAIGCFEDAVRRESDSAPAWAALADARAVAAALRYGPLSPRESYEKAREAARRALALDATLATAHTALALVLAHGDRDPIRAEREFQIALRLDPRSATALQRYAHLLMRGGRLDAAIEVTERALALDPHSPAVNANLCYFLYLKRSYDRAGGYCDKAIELQPDLAQPLTTRALIEVQARRLGHALELLARARKHAEGTALLDLLDAQGYAYAVSGRRDRARTLLAQLERLTPGDDPRRFARLGTHTALGDTERAFEKLRSCARESCERPFEVEFDPRYDSLRGDPRYAEVMPPPEPAASGAPVGGAGDGERQAISTVY